MTLLQALIYGAVQGLTEYLPVSSSAHLILLPKVMGIVEPGLSFDVFLHAGTLAATLLYFRKDWGAIWRGQNPVGRWEMLLACVPALAVGALGRQWIGAHLRGTHTVAWAMITGGILLWLADRFSGGTRSLSKITRSDALGVGLFQCLALWPGMSRSGSTILGGRFLGLSREAAARFSFLVSAPITAAALVFELRHFSEITSGLGETGITSVWVGACSAFVFGWFAIDVLIRFVSRIGLGGFSAYRILLGLYLLKFAAF